MSLFRATAMRASLFRPLRAMTMAMERIRDSRDYSARVELMGDEETRGVIDTLNAMLDEVERRDNELAEAALALAAARDQAQKASAAKSQFLAKDRKSDVEGKSVSGRVEPGGRRTIKKK